jgi:O-antigen ligase
VKTSYPLADKSTTYIIDWILLFLAGVVFILPPLFFLEFKQDEWVNGFIPIRMVNAELKFCIFIIITSFIVGITWIRAHLGSQFKSVSKQIYIFCGVFLISVFISTITAHNIERAFVYSFVWHALPILFAFSIFQIKWTINRMNGFISLILLGGLISCLVVMDQHYKWTDWSHRLPRLGYGGLIYNRNFAAEYHAPLLPLVLCLVFVTESKIQRGMLLGSLVFIFMPALSLSLARGAWVGLIAGCFLTGLIFILMISLRKKDLKKENRKSALWISCSFILLSIALPVFLFTSDLWKKKGPSTRNTEIQNQSSTESQELKSITNVKDASVNRRIVLWKDALESVLSKDFLFGKGTDHYELHFHESALRSDRTTGGTLVRFVHNDFIQILYENGIIGLIGFLGIWIIALWKGIRKAIEYAVNGDTANLALTLGLIACCMVFLIESFFEFPTRSPCALIVGWTSLGLLLVLAHQKSENEPFQLIRPITPKLNLIIGALAVGIIPFGCILAKDLFWANIYHFQGRITGDFGQKDKSLKFHRKSIEYAPWEHHSRKFECFYLLTHKKQFMEALEAINKTLEVHPGCLVAHQNKIAISINEFKDFNLAKAAYKDMKIAAPYHPFTLQEWQKIEQIKP